MPHHLRVHLNARLQPVHRHPLEDALQEALDQQAPGFQVDGGGTLIGNGGEPLSCDIEIAAEAEDTPVADLAAVASAALPRAPRGSYTVLDGGEPVAFGSMEGLGLYLNGTGLPAEVYDTCSADELIGLLKDRLGDEGSYTSYWRGPTETALYLYGPSASRMNELISDLLATYPLARSGRLVAIT